MRRKKKKFDLRRLRADHATLNARLKRARHLYYTLFYKGIVKYVSFGDRAEERMIELGRRMRDRGLYAATTSNLSLGLAVTRNLAREREKRYGDQSLWRIRHESRMSLAVERVSLRSIA